MSAAPFPYTGEPARLPVVKAALKRVVDPEMALDIVALGLVYGVDLEPGRAHVRLTMTSAACPVTEFIVDEVAHELRSALGRDVKVDVQLCWDPPWEPARMSPGARSAMGWD